MKLLSHQVLLLYCLALALYVYVVCSWPLGLRQEAALLLCWAGMSAYVYLWLVSRYRRLRKKQTIKGRVAGEDHLPSQLIYSMRSRQSFESGVRALKAFDGAFFLMVALFLMYVFYGVLVYVIGAVKLQPLVLVDIHIEEFFSRFAPSQGYGAETGSFYLEGFLSHTVRLLMIGVLIWLTRVLSLSSKPARFIPWYGIVLFLLSFMVLLVDIDLRWPRLLQEIPLFGYGPGSADAYERTGMLTQPVITQMEIRFFEGGLAGNLIFYALVVVVLVSLIRNVFRKTYPIGHTACALLILTIMGFLDIFAVYQDKHQVLYLLGALSVSGLSVQSHMHVRKRHTLFS